jgi:hypothetical protein
MQQNRAISTPTSPAKTSYEESSWQTTNAGSIFQNSPVPTSKQHQAFERLSPDHPANFTEEISTGPFVQSRLRMQSSDTIPNQVHQQDLIPSFTSSISSGDSHYSSLFSNELMSSS